MRKEDSFMREQDSFMRKQGGFMRKQGVQRQRNSVENSELLAGDGQRREDSLDNSQKMQEMCTSNCTVHDLWCTIKAIC